MKDIARLSRVGYATPKLMWPGLEKNGIIKQTRAIGKARMFRFNLKNPIFTFDKVRAYHRNKIKKKSKFY